MKWRSADGCRRDREERKKVLVNSPIKHFAWLPVETCNGNMVWLEHYWKMYLFVPATDYHCAYGNEYNYESLEAAERAKR